MNPYSVVHSFEETIAEWCGSKYAVAVESGTAAIFLSLIRRKQEPEYKDLSNILIPAKTYPSIPCSIINAGFKVVFDKDKIWEGEYELFRMDIWDAALRLKRGMYHGGFQCLSFHIKKHLQIGRAGMILTDNKDAYEWFKLARFDGREAVPLQQQKDFTVLGYNMYMEPTSAARGIQLFEVMKQRYPDGPPDLPVESQGYPDLSQFKIYTQ